MQPMLNRQAIAMERIVYWSVQASLLAGIYYMYTQGNGTKVFMGCCGHGGHFACAKALPLSNRPLYLAQL
ncbi:hypothetical protein [Planococcus sp. ISL-110]|uniref:hypothetical protein n=1 Tax=Planococcus sp. ISL-110 TaxID=2819167 RepID=UPI001BE5E3BF|nr:hypothetical protein [Planococcus sp. ISL-110]MBT2570079.1 hypothetical protein [Planococcus sp. ISL-110]